MKEVFLDWETRSLADLLEVGSAVYFADPSTEGLMLAWAIDDEEVQIWEPDLGPIPTRLENALRDATVKKIAWRVEFERSCFEKFCKIEIPIEEWFDVMVLARYMSLPGKLGEACSALKLPSEVSKMVEEGDEMIQLFSIPADRGGRETLWGVEPPFFNSRENHSREWETFKTYCKQDTFVERYIYRLLHRFMLPEEELQNWYLDQTINRRGMPVAMTFAQNGLKMALQSIDKLRGTLKELTGLENPNSDSQILEWVTKQGYPYTSMNKNLVKAALEGTSLTPLAREVLEIRKEFRRSSYKKLESILHRVSADGRLRDLFAFMGGSRTGRWAGQDVQFQNLARPDKKVEKNLARALQLIETSNFDAAIEEFSPEFEIEGKKHKIPSVIGMVISCLRSIFQAEEGKILVVCDLSAIENRVLGWLAGCDSILKVFRDNLDPYLAFAALMYRIPYSQVSKDQRQVAKPAVLGCGYGLGPGVLRLENPDTGEVTYSIIWKCSECLLNAHPDHECRDEKGNRKGDLQQTGLLGYAANMGVKLTPKQAWDAHRAFQQEYPEVPQLWWDLEKAAICTIQTGKKSVVRFIEFSRVKRKDGTFLLRIKLPSGRYLHYLNARVTSDIKKSKRTGKEYTKHSIFYDGIGHGVGATTHKIGWAPVYSYGGKLAENVTQAVSRDILAHGMRLADEIGMTIVGHVHDEIVCEEEKDGFGLLDLKSCMSETPVWAPGLPLSADGYESKVYKK